MWILGLILAGVAAGALMDSDDDDAQGETAVNSEETDGTSGDEITTTTIVRDGEVGSLIEGTDSADRLIGTDGPDILSGEDGDDTLRALDGIDVLLGGAGDDMLFGQDGEDLLAGGDGNDALHGGQDSDILLGETGNDMLFGGPGDDLLVGADMLNRSLDVGDVLEDRPVPAPLSIETPTESEANELYGGRGDDVLIVAEGDTATGDEGLDTFVAGFWIEDESNVPLITDYDVELDTIELDYPADEPAPTITLGSDNDETLVFADGGLVLRVQGDGGPFFANEIRLVPVTL